MIKLPKRRNCKICGKSFKPEYLQQWGCDKQHQEDYAVSLLDKVRKSRQKSAEALQRRQRAAERRNLKERKFALSKPAQQANEAQAAFNRYIRIRDYGEPCISCGKLLDWGGNGALTGGGIDASHFRSVGAAAHLRFNTFNVWASCKECNQHKSGNIAEYRPRLVEKIGAERVERLEQDHSIRKFDGDYYARVKKIFTKRGNRLKKRKGLA